MKDGLLVYVVLGDQDEKLETVVVPKSERSLILELAYDKCRHVGIKKMKGKLNKCFTWPGLGRMWKDLYSLVMSVQESTRQGQKPVKLIGGNQWTYNMGFHGSMGL